MISSSLLVLLITIQITNSGSMASLLLVLILIINFSLLVLMPQTIYKIRKKCEQQKFDKKLLELQRELKDISVKYEQSEILEKPVKLNLPQPFNPNEFPTLVKYDSQKIEDAIQKLMKDRSMTRQQCLVNLEQDLSEIESR